MQKPRGISSAGRAPALQAGGRRFDPVILHQDSSESELIAWKNATIAGSLQYKSTLAQSAFVLRWISIGCSLKIHRVEISIADGNTLWGDRAVSNYLIASTRIQLLNSCNDEYSQSCVERHSQRYSHYGITREVWDLTSLWTRIWRFLATEVKVIGSSD